MREKLQLLTKFLEVYNFVEMKRYKILFLFVPLFLIFCNLIYAERPELGISGVTGSSGTVKITYTANDSNDTINTVCWQYSTDGTTWYAVSNSAVGNNAEEVSGSSYITWNSTAGTYNLNNSSSSTVYFRMRSYNNQGLVWVSSATPFQPYAGACWNERSERLRAAESASAYNGEFAGYDSELEMTDSSTADIGNVESLACELAAGATYLWQGTNGYLWKGEDPGNGNLAYIDYWATAFFVTGLAWDGNNLWGCGSKAGTEGYVFKYLDPAIDSYQAWYWAANLPFSGLTWDGETLWSCVATDGASTNNIGLHNMDANLNISEAFTTANNMPYGLASNGEYLYVTTWDGVAQYGIYKYEIPVSTYSTYGPFTINNIPGVPAGYFSDDFEAGEFDSFWTVTQEYGSVSLSTLQSHAGSQSAKFSSISGGEKNISLSHEYPSPIKGNVSIWFYDSAPGEQTLYAQLSLYNTTVDYGNSGYSCYIGIDDWVPSVYTLRDPDTQSVFQTSYSRTLGWHKLEIKVGDNSVEYLIDGSQVKLYSYDFNFNVISIVVYAPDWRPNATYYFDDFICPADTSQEEELVGHWTFEEGSGSTVSDSSDYENDGTIYGNGAGISYEDKVNSYYRW